jgi:hypothetical protein
VQTPFVGIVATASCQGYSTSVGIAAVFAEASCDRDAISVVFAEASCDCYAISVFFAEASGGGVAISVVFAETIGSRTGAGHGSSHRSCV